MNFIAGTKEDFRNVSYKWEHQTDKTELLFQDTVESFHFFLIEAEAYTKVICLRTHKYLDKLTKNLSLLILNSMILQLK